MSVYVVGHKSPDTDSVTAAIAYAELMKAKGEDYIPCINGDPNPETKMVLEKFGAATPTKLSDATGKKIALVDHSDLAQAPEASQEIITQLRLLRSTVEVKLDQFERADRSGMWFHRRFR